MRKIFKIAITELCTLFYSPIAWLILIIFTVQAGMHYLKVIDIMLMQQFSRPLWYSIAKELLTGGWGIFPHMLGHLYLYIPLLTMGLMSRELSSGSIKLLYSSPVSSVQIILGKFLSMMFYSLVLVGILLVFVVFAMIHVPEFDVPLMLSGLLGIYLVICAYAAIGLFMSCLTHYQVVAAVATLAVLMLLNYVGRIGQGIPFVEDITYWLSINGRSDELIDGLINSEDILYFLIVITLFLTLAVMKIQAGKKKRTKGMSALRYGGVVVAALMLGYVSSRPRLQVYYDASYSKQNSLNDVSQEIMKKLEGDLTLTTYVNLLDVHGELGFPDNVNHDKSRFKKYILFKPDMKLRYVYYYAEAGNEALNELYPNLEVKQKAWKVAQLNDLDIDMFLSPEEIAKQIDLSEEEYRFVRQLQRESGEKAFLRIYDDGQRDPTEAEITTAMKRLVAETPKVFFLTGHGERSVMKAGDRDYYTFAKSPAFRHSLINKGFEVNDLFITDSSEIPDDVSILVIADLQSDLTEDELQKIERYVRRGGNMIIAGEPGNVQRMNRLTSLLGVRLMPGALVQPSGGVYADDLLVCQFTSEGVRTIPSYAGLLRQNYRITMPGAVGLSYDTLGDFNVIPVLDTEAGKEERAFPTMLALARQVGEREQRMVVLGDADCISNSELLMSRAGIKGANFSLLTGMFRWLSYDEFPITLKGITPRDKVLNLSKSSMPWVRGAFLWLFPFLFAAGYLGIWLKRRRG